MEPLKVMLHGYWERRIGAGQIDAVRVPGTYKPVGECTLALRFDLPSNAAEEGGRWFLCTDGVLSTARFSINGHEVGKAGAYAPCRFEIPGKCFAPQNEIVADIRDISEPFGPTPGRKFEAGLYRDIWIEQRPDTFIESVRLTSVLSEDLATADCTVDVALNGDSSLPVSVTLRERDSGRVVYQGEAPHGQACFRVDSPHLWSPDAPFLYELEARTEDGDAVRDIAGFRMIEVRDRDFYLNGRRIVLAGVCRHEFSEQSGYAPSADEIRYELARIRHAGFNFVRLVHSPQALVVSRIAAELGLMVSEEPGLCFHNLSDEVLVGPALDTFRRLVIRDRNCPSVVSWMIYNECLPNTDYAVRAAALIRELDVGRLIGMADCSRRYDEIREMVRSAGLDYYGINLYGTEPRPYIEVMKIYTDKPLLFTEWGGGYVQNAPKVLTLLCDMFAEHVQNSAEPRVAGGCFWAWADYEERSRGDLVTSRDGFTIEGLTDVEGRDKPELATLSRMCFDMNHPAPVCPAPVEILTHARRPADEVWRPVSLDGVDGEQSSLEDAVDARRVFEGRTRIDYRNRRPHFGSLIVAGIPFTCRKAGAGWPLLLGSGRDTLVIPVDRSVRQVAILGHVAMAGGYPGNSTASCHHGSGEPVPDYGSPASVYEFVFVDGTERIELHHGIHVLRANDIVRWYMTAPRAPETVPAVRSVLHPTFEILRFDLWTRTFEKTGPLKEIRWSLSDPNSIQAMLAVSLLE